MAATISAASGKSRRKPASPFVTAIGAACSIAVILLTLGALSMLATRRIMQRDAQEVFTAAVAAAAGAVADPGQFSADSVVAAHDAQRVVNAVAHALPEGVAIEFGVVRGDSATVLAERIAPSDADHTPPAPRLGTTTHVAPEIRNSWAGGRPALLVTDTRFSWASGFQVVAPVRANDSTVVAAVSATAHAAHYARWDADLRETLLLGIAVTLGLATLAGIGVYRVEADRAESSRQLVSAKEAAEGTARSRGEFLANMSHEIRTPLHGVLGMTEALLASPHTEADRRSLSVINRSASSLLGILNDILDYSKLEAGRVDLVNAPFDPRSLVDDVTDLFAVRAEEKGLDLAVRETTRAEQWPVGDAARLRQVLLNLVGNAVKFTEKGSVQVELSTVAIGRKTVVLRVAVRDTGIGIAQDVQAQVFEQFSQADTTTARRFGGTGLGLTISRQLILLMGGSIAVSSVPGEGSEFVVNVQLPAASMPTDGQLVLPFAAGERVLICTPLKATRLALSELCARERLAVETCVTPAEAERILARGDRYVMAFSDAPASLDAAHPLSRQRAPLIMLTTVHHPLNNSSLSSLGAVGQLRRPVRQDHFSALIADVSAGKLKVPAAEAPAPKTVAPAAPPAQKPTAKAAPASNPALPTVLVVDDVDLNLLVARAMLGSLGVNVRTAAGGEEALDILSRERMDLVLMDCHMPGLDGYDVTRCVRGSEGPNRHSPIVALSASAFAEDKERAITSGMNDFATKPIELESLRNVLTRWTSTAPATTA
ncbi:MAG: ATP-binding protein [Gemmatimonadota bacterium]|nr:ATP-binding protein [Gemmatimonadota bacterium]